MVATLRHPPAPFVAPVSGDINQRLQQLADAINAKQSATSPPTWPFIGLRSPDGTTWKVSVDNAGTIATEAVPRT
jgi:phosphoketolase